MLNALFSSYSYIENNTKQTNEKYIPSTVNWTWNERKRETVETEGDETLHFSHNLRFGYRTLLFLINFELNDSSLSNIPTIKTYFLQSNLKPNNRPNIYQTKPFRFLQIHSQISTFYASQIQASLDDLRTANQASIDEQASSQRH